MKYISCSWVVALICILTGSLPLNVSQTTATSAVSNPGFVNDADAFNSPTNFLNFRGNSNYNRNNPFNDRVRSPRGRRNRRVRQARQPRWQRKLYRLFPITMNGLFGNSYGYNQRNPGENNGLYGELFLRGYPTNNQQPTPNFQPQSFGARTTPQFYQNQAPRSSSQSFPARRPTPFYNLNQREQANYNQQQLQPDGTFAPFYDYNGQRMDSNVNYLDRPEQSNFLMSATGDARGTLPNTRMMGSRLASERENNGNGMRFTEPTTELQPTRNQSQSSFLTSFLPSYFRNRNRPSTATAAA